MMIEWEDHGEEERRLLLEYVDRMKPQPAPPPPHLPKPTWFWRLLARLHLEYLLWRDRRNR